MRLPSMALLVKGDRLARKGQFADALATYDRVLARCAKASTRDDDLAVVALFSKGTTLAVMGHQREAIETFDEVVARFGDHTETPRVGDWVAKTFVNKSLLQGAQGQLREAIETCQDMVARFADAAEPAIREQIAAALLHKALMCAGLGQWQQAIEVFDDVAARFADVPEPALRARGAISQLGKGMVLAKQDRVQDAIEVWGHLSRRFTDAPEPGIRGQVAKALLLAGVALGIQGRPEDARQAYDQVIALCSDSHTLRWCVGAALFLRALVAAGLGQAQETQMAFEQLLTDFTNTTAISQHTISVFGATGTPQFSSPRSPDKGEDFNATLAQWTDTTEPRHVEQITATLVSKIIAFGMSGQIGQAMRFVDQILARLADNPAPSPAIQEQITRVQALKGATMAEMIRHQARAGKEHNDHQ